MTIDVKLATIADSIAGLSITGVNVRDIDQIPENALAIIPVLYPLPNGFVTDMIFTRESVGADAVAAMNVTYILHYRYLHAVVGSGGGLLAVYSGLITNMVIILEAIFANSTPSGSVNMELVTVSDIGVLTDPGGQTQYHGVDFSLRVLEYVQ